jgi:hypothetical protein
MSKNSTLKLWNFLLKEEYSAFDRSVHKILSETQLEAKKETIIKILAYARSVKGIKMRSNDKILIFLN